MKIVIIEDESLTAEDLAAVLISLPNSIEITKILSSVSEAVEYFKRHELPDLIFSDIHLGDGSSFEIFRQIPLNVPVIFCTAYDTYAIDAFRNNGIDYILKPFTKKTIRETIDKYYNLRSKFTRAIVDHTEFFQQIASEKNISKRATSLLIAWKDKIIPVRISDIAFLFIEHKTTFLVTADQQKHAVTYTLEELEEICGDAFFRASRQYLVNRDFIAEALQYLPRKLLLKLRIESKHEIVVGKNRIPEFLSWLRI